MKCAKCQYDLQEVFKFCPMCGLAVATVGENQSAGLVFAQAAGGADAGGAAAANGKAESSDKEARGTENEFILTIQPGLEMVFLRVPAGDFIMGSTAGKGYDVNDDEEPQHNVFVSEFWIGKYPVTNLQYQAFVRAVDYPRPEHWVGGGIPFAKENHPVVRVNWNDAIAFCEWLRDTTGERIYLPNEAEWEKAARGTDGRLWPWGNMAPNAQRCNFSGVHGDTTEIGRYSPGGDSPFGCADMAGNVWEWTASLRKPYPFHSPLDRYLMEEEGPRVLRGGSWGSNVTNIRTAYRYRNFPRDSAIGIGFRCLRSK